MIKNLTPLKRPVELERLRHVVYIESHRHPEAYKWCEQTFGTKWNPVDNRAGVWGMYWGGITLKEKYQFRFTHEQDMAWFRLRWGV